MKCNSRILYLNYLLALIAIGPIIRSILTWSVGEKRTLLQYELLHYSYVTIVLESVLILLVISSGINLTAIIKRIGVWQVWMIMLIAASAILSGISVVINSEQVWAATFVWFIHFLFAYSLITISLQSSVASSFLFWKVLVVSAVGYTLLVIVFFNAVSNPDMFPWVDHMPGVTNIRHVGYFLSPALVLAIGFYFINMGNKLILVFALMLLACFGAWSGSRGMFLAAIMSFPVALFIYPALRNFRSWLVLLTAIVMAVTLSTKIPMPAPQFGIVSRLSQSIEGTAPEFSSGRKMIWEKTGKMIGVSPLIGYGAGMYRLVMESKTGYPFNHPHNLILQILFQWGVIGGVGVFSLILAVWLKTLKAAMEVGIEAAPALLVLNDLLVYSLFDGTGYYPWPIVVMMIAIASILVLRRDKAINPSVA
jgi:O-antigen ligase